jgi:hypothetical protein
VLKNSTFRLNDNGYVAINISDYNDNKGRVRICDDMVKYVTEELGLLFCGTSGYHINNRYVAYKETKDMNIQENILVSRDKVLTEPMFIFKKGKSFNVNELNTGIVKDFF